MSRHVQAHQPLQLSSARKTEVRTQFAVLAFRVETGKNGPKTRVCLITSRTTKRWIMPKGWPMPGLSPAEAAAREAYEEAGVEGVILPDSLGLYSYRKRIARASVPVIAVIYAMEVTKVHKTWPEARQRTRKWMSLKKASARISDPELRQVIANFDPFTMRR